MLLAALATVLVASCYDGDTCTTATGERVRLACVDTPELVAKTAESVPARDARDHLRDLVVCKKVANVGSLKTGMDDAWQSCSWGRQMSSMRLSSLVMQMSFDAMRSNVHGKTESIEIDVIF